LVQLAQQALKENTLKKYVLANKIGLIFILVLLVLTIVLVFLALH